MEVQLYFLDTTGLGNLLTIIITMRGVSQMIRLIGGIKEFQETISVILTSYLWFNFLPPASDCKRYCYKYERLMVRTSRQIGNIWLHASLSFSIHLSTYTSMVKWYGRGVLAVSEFHIA